MLRCALGFVLPLVFIAIFATVTFAVEIAASGESKLSPKSFGITVRFIPNHARPGDVVQLRAEMDRDTWGQFDLHVPANPDMHAITVEKIPLQYQDGRYRQQQSLVFQPKRSGALRVSGATIDVVTSRGRQTVTVPDLTLVIEPTGITDTTTTPVPLPTSTPAQSSQSLAFFAAAVGIGLVFLLAIFVVARKHRNRQPTAAPSTSQSPPPTDNLVHLLQSGQMPRHDLERLLADPNFTASVDVRAAIERAVYAEEYDTAQLAHQLQQQEGR
ncbi:hypothetical protein [Novipirellula caenicola]|uniref:Protein BatD n=1 Tax=Novipirellula caenicola TaxID=1536901 RepID=A0ABP9VS21_9BACT